MDINELLKKKRMTMYKLSKLSGIPHTTINDICSKKTCLKNCSVETVYKIASALEVSIDELVSSFFEKRCSFETYKSNVCHQLKELGDIQFLIKALTEDNITKYYKKSWYLESLYLLAIVDYVSRENNVELCNKYDYLRKIKLPKPVFPQDVIATSLVMKSDLPKTEALMHAIPEFVRHNIVESEVRDVV